MAEALPEGDMPPPNKVLQLEWLYMSFYSEDHVKYIESEQCHYNKTLESVAEYFENIYNLQVANGSLAKKHKGQIEYCAKCKLCHMLKKHYKAKLCCIAEQHCTSNGHSNGHNKTYRSQDYNWEGPNHSHCCPNYDKREKKQEDKLPSNCSDKAFKPCPTIKPSRSVTGTKKSRQASS